MRLIDADAIVYKNGGWADEYEIDHMPTISPAANWTPCSVALPEKEHEDYLCYVKIQDDHTWYRFAVCIFNSGGWVGVPGWNGSGAVIAWQPLPEPYRGEA